MTPNEVSALYAVSRITVLRWITHGVSGIRLNATRLGGRWRITREDCETFHACVTDAANRERNEKVTGNRPIIASQYRATGKAGLANRVKSARVKLNN
jgi:excisionase family DNA binding protein